MFLCGRSAYLTAEPVTGTSLARFTFGSKAPDRNWIVFQRLQHGTGSAIHSARRRGGRVAEGARLESV
jgi:hypothetical protein